MQVLQRALGFIGIKAFGVEKSRPDYQHMMKDALDRVAMAERMLQEANSLEQLDLARSAYQAAQAEVQQVIRMAKRERGIALRPIAETEELHRRMRAYMNGTSPDRTPKGRKGGTGRAG